MGTFLVRARGSTMWQVRVAVVLALSLGYCLRVGAQVSTESVRLQISVVVTDRGNEVFEAWDRPTGRPFNVESVKTAKRGQFLSAIVLFKGCKPDAAGNCEAELELTAYDPSGKVYGKMSNAELWRGKPAPGPGMTQLSRDYMGIVIEPNDPIGTYRVMAVARDQIAKTEARSEVVFQVGM